MSNEPILKQSISLDCQHCDETYSLLPANVGPVTYEGQIVPDPFDITDGDIHIKPFYFHCRSCKKMTIMFIRNDLLGTDIWLARFPGTPDTKGDAHE